MAIATTPMKNQNDAKCSNVGQPGTTTGEGAASYVSQKVEDATAAVGGGLKSLGNTIRDNTAQGGMVGDASSAVANSLENTGRYLQEQGLTGIAEDATNLIRRNPLPAVLVGIGLGFLLAKLTTRS